MSVKLYLFVDLGTVVSAWTGTCRRVFAFKSAKIRFYLEGALSSLPEAMQTGLLALPGGLY